MSLTNEDLMQIRGIVDDVVQRHIRPIQGELDALRNDISEIYECSPAYKKAQ